jgi:predicted ATPase
MKLVKFSFENNHTDWKLAETDFHPHLNLLVGASGVGKTKILEALKTAVSVASGTRFNTLFETNWTLEFQLNKDIYCEWRIKFGAQKGDRNGSEMPLIINELLIINKEIIFERNKKDTFFKGKLTLNLNREESLISLLNEENAVKDIYNAFLKQPHSIESNTKDYNQNSELFTKTLNELAHNYANINELRDFNQSLWVKLAMLYSIDLKAFNKIRNTFIEIFPTIENIKFDVAKLSNGITLFYIKERGVKNWISQYDISAGMFKTFIELGRIYLSPNNSLILIDEFENSLGVNCIDAVTESILNSNRNNQFVITSHHPYIINNIPVKNWKIVSREGGLVRTHTADAFGIGNSRLTAFMELQQLDVFLTGSESIV